MDAIDRKILAVVQQDASLSVADIGQKVGVVLPHDVQFRLVLVWGPVAAVIAVISMLIFSSYAITRTRHAEIAAALRAKRDLGDGAQVA